MQFIKLEGETDCFIRPESIQSVDVQRDEHGRITSLSVSTTETSYDFEDEEAERNYSILYPFLTS